MIASVMACVAVLFAPPAPLGADSAAAVRRAETYVAAENYPAARAALAEAAATEQHPAILFVQGQIERLAGDCAAAIGYYEAFAELQSDPADASAAHQWIAHCQAQLPEPTAVAEASQPPVAPEKPAWRRDRWGAGLVAMGAVTLGAGTGVLAAGLVGRPDPAETPTEGDYSADVARSRTLVGTGAVLVPLGVSVIVAGVIRYALVARRGRGQLARVSASFGPTTTIAVRF